MSNRRLDKGPGRWRAPLGDRLNAWGAKLAESMPKLGPRKNRRKTGDSTLRKSGDAPAAKPAKRGKAKHGRRVGAAAEAAQAARAAEPETRRTSGIRFALTAAAFLAPVVVAVLAFSTPLLGVRAYEYVMETGHFHVRTIRIAGNERLSREDLRQELGIDPGEHLLKTDMNELQQRLLAHPWIRWAKVERELPDGLIVEVVEHSPAAYLSAGELWVVNRSGEPFARVSPDDSEKLPIITGVTRARLEDPANRSDALADIRAALNLHQLYRSMGYDGRWPIGEVRVDPVRGMTLIIGGVGTEAVLGRSPYRDKLYRLEWVLENLRQQGKVAEYIILDMARDTRRSDDDGRVIVKAAIAPKERDVMARAAERAREAERRVLGLPPNGDIFGPSLPTAGGLGFGVTGNDDDTPARPALSGGRPAVMNFDLSGEEY